MCPVEFAQECPVTSWRYTPITPSQMSNCVNFVDPSLPLAIDIGSGLGNFVLGMSEHSNSNWLGVDLQPVAVRYANAMASRAGVQVRPSTKHVVQVRWYHNCVSFSLIQKAAGTQIDCETRPGLILHSLSCFHRKIVAPHAHIHGQIDEPWERNDLLHQGSAI